MIQQQTVVSLPDAQDVKSDQCIQLMDVWLSNTQANIQDMQQIERPGPQTREGVAS